jgi:hypothetical protein
MNRSIRALWSTLAALCLTLGLLTVPASAGAAEAIHYTPESMATFEQQMNAGQIKAAVFNRKVRSIRLTLKSGEYALVHYPKGQAPALEATLSSKHVAVSQLSEALANKELRAKPKKHKLRYIAGGIVIVVVVVVGGVLLINRRRQRQLD